MEDKSNFFDVVMLRIKFTGQHPSERDDKRRRQKKQKSNGFNLRREKNGGSQYRNVKRGVKERNRKAQQNQGELEEKESRGGAFNTKKGSLLLMKEKKKKEQKKSSFSPPGRSVKPNQCLVWQRCSSPRHRLTMEASLGRHTSHFKSASSRTGLRARGPRGGTTMRLKCLNSHKKISLW